MVELAGVVGPLGRSEGGQIGARCTLWLEKMQGEAQTGQADGRDGLATGGVKTMQEMLCNDTHTKTTQTKRKLPPERIVLDWS